MRGVISSGVRRFLSAVSTLAVYGAAAVWWSWPLARDARAALPDPGGSGKLLFDTLFNAWVLAWETHALATAPAMLTSANAFHPTAHALFYGPTAFGVLPLFAPVYLASGSALLSLNATLVGGIALTAWGVHRVLLVWTGSQAAGVVGGAALLASTWLWSTMAYAPYITMLAPMPWIVHLVARGPATRRAAAVLGALIAWQLLVDPIQYAVAVGVPLAGVAAWRARRAATRPAALRMAVALAGALACASPVYAGYLAVRLENPELAQQTTWRTHLPAEEGEVMGTLLRRMLHDLPADAALESSWPRLAAVALGLLLARRRKAWTPAWEAAAAWTAVGLVGTVLLLPVSHFLLLAAFGALRSLHRIHADAVVGVPLLLGLTFATVAPAAGASRRGRALAGIAAVAAAAALLGQASLRRSGAYPLAAVASPAPDLLPLLHMGRGALLELPAPQAGAPGYPRGHAEAMYRSTFHWRPLLNGYASFWPAAFPQRMDLVAQLPDRDALAALVRETGLELVLVRLRDMPPWQRAVWTDPKRVREAGLDTLARRDEEWLYIVSPAIRFLPGTPAPHR